MIKKRNMIHKLLTLFVATTFLISGSTVAYGSTPQVAAAGGSSDRADFKAALETVVAKAFVGLAEETGDKVVSAITPEVEGFAGQLDAAVSELNEQKEAIETKGYKINAKIPGADVINNIPPEGLAQVQSQVQAEIQASIAQDFAESEAEVQAKVKALAQTAAPAIAQKIEPMIKTIVPKIHDIIEASINERVEEKILNALPGLMTMVPDEMAGMSPDEIAAEMKAEIKPAIESVVRPEFEEKIKKQVDTLMLEKVKAPLVDKFQPAMVKLDASAYDQYIDQLPDYIEKVVSKSFIKAEVSKNIEALQAKLPAMVENSRAEIDSKINAAIDAIIEKEAKIYIGDTYVSTPIQPQTVNNRLLVPFRAIATALGAEVEWKYKERQVVMTKGDTNVVLTIDSNVVLVNGKEAKIDAAAEIYQNYTIVPLRFLAETFDMDVNWQRDWKMVNIEEKQ